MAQIYPSLLVFIGGGLGSVCRYLFGAQVNKYLGLNLPFSTFTINILGCFLIGIFSAFFSRPGLPEYWKMLFITGFCGGFTTFSTFSYENYNLLVSGNALVPLFYSSSSFVVGLWAVVIGIRLGALI